MEARTLRRNPGRVATALLTLALAGGPGAAAGAPAAATLTGVSGPVKGAGDRALERLNAVADEEAIETGEDGNCSLLFQEDALVELCGGTSLRVARRDEQSPRVVRVDKGEARIVVEPGAAERIEIHTPAAIATILGTVVYVTVDAETGETTITSVANEVVVRSAAAGVAGEVRITGGEQVTTEVGKAPERPRSLEQRALQDLGGCLVDFRALALTTDRGSHEVAAIEEAATLDVVDDVPPVGPAGPSADVGQDDPTGVDPVNPPDLYEAPQVDQLPVDTVSVPSCGPLPGDHCGF